MMSKGVKKVLKTPISVSTTYLINEIASRHTENIKKLTGETVFAMINNNDKIADTVLNKMLRNLLYGINNICSILNPEVIILGGGIMQQEKILQPRINYWAKKILPAVFYENTKIKFARLGNDAGMFGALYYHLSAKNK